MISKALVRQIEDHSARLAQEVLAAIRNDSRTQSYHHLTEAHVRGAVEGLFQNLEHWLSSRTDLAVERHYQKIGHQRFLEGVPLSEVIYAFSLVGATLIRFLRGSVVGDTADLHVEYELALSISEFNEKSIYYVSRGYEDARKAGVQSSKRPEATVKEFVPRQPKEAWDPAEKWNAHISRGGDIGEMGGYPAGGAVGAPRTAIVIPSRLAIVVSSSQSTSITISAIVIGSAVLSAISGTNALIW